MSFNMRYNLYLQLGVSIEQAKIWLGQVCLMVLHGQEKFQVMRKAEWLQCPWVIFCRRCGISVRWSMALTTWLPAASPTVSVTLFPSFALPVPRGRPACLPDVPNTLLAEAFALTACIFQKQLLFGCFQAHFLPSLTLVLNSHSTRWLPLAP